MDRGAWWAAVHGVSESQTRLSDVTFTFHFHALEKEMATHSSVLAWRIPKTEGRGGSLVDCRLWDRTESDTTEATWQQQHVQNRITSCFLVWAKNCVWFLQSYAPPLPLPLDTPQKYSRKGSPGS